MTDNILKSDMLTLNNVKWIYAIYWQYLSNTGNANQPKWEELTDADRYELCSRYTEIQSSNLDPALIHKLKQNGCTQDNDWGITLSPVRADDPVLSDPSLERPYEETDACKQVLEYIMRTAAIYSVALPTCEIQGVEGSL
jgi:hypothetical protein